MYRTMAGYAPGIGGGRRGADVKPRNKHRRDEAERQRLPCCQPCQTREEEEEKLGTRYAPESHQRIPGGMSPGFRQSVQGYSIPIPDAELDEEQVRIRTSRCLVCALAERQILWLQLRQMGMQLAADHLEIDGLNRYEVYTNPVADERVAPIGWNEYLMARYRHLQYP